MLTGRPSSTHQPHNWMFPDVHCLCFELVVEVGQPPQILFAHIVYQAQQSVWAILLRGGLHNGTQIGMRDGGLCLCIVAQFFLSKQAGKEQGLWTACTHAPERPQKPK